MTKSQTLNQTNSMKASDKKKQRVMLPSEANSDSEYYYDDSYFNMDSEDSVHHSDFNDDAFEVF